MIKWGDFITESKIIELLLEGQCSATQNFLDKLEQISDRSGVAEYLFSFFGGEIDIDFNLSQNYIDITDKEDMITFLPDSRAQRHSGGDLFKVNGRSEMAVGRFARRFISEVNKNIRFSDKEFEEFVNLYKSSSKNESYFKLVSGNEIIKCYNEENYASTNGTLGGSCMATEECEDFFGIYTDNSQCRLLVYFDESNKVLGRALVWKISESPCNAEYFMDRVYTSRDSDVNRFVSYAEEKGWMYKLRMNAYEGDNILFRYKGEVVVGKLVIKLKDADFEVYPFMDTVRYVNREEKFASNVGSKGQIECNGTEGSDFSEECYICWGDGIVDSDCPNCNDGNETCDVCSGTGDTKCMKCHGEGLSNKQVDCSSCNGEGRVRRIIRRVVCTQCKGSGKINDFCDKCNGFGLVKCKKCSGDGEVDCKYCDATGKLNDVGCPSCAWHYLTLLKKLSDDNGYRIYRSKILEELEKEIKKAVSFYDKNKRKK